MIVERPEAGMLRLRAVRWKALSRVAGYALVAAVWYAVLLGTLPPGQGQDSLGLLLYLLPLLGLPAAYRAVRLLLAGETIVFRSDTGTVTRNGKRLAEFGEIASVRIRTIEEPESADEHRVALVLKSGEEVRVAQSPRGEWTSALAEEIADLLGVGVARATGAPGFSLTAEVLSGDGGLTGEERRMKEVLERRLGRRVEDSELSSLTTWLKAEKAADARSKQPER